MATKRKTRKTNSVQGLTHVQLASLAKRLQTQYAKLAKSPAWKTFQGMTPAQQRKVIQQKLTKVAKFLRTKSIKNVDVKLKALKSQMARRLDLALNHPKVTSAAIKRLTLIRRNISKAPSVARLTTICGNLKLTSFKNPKTRKTSTTKARTKSTYRKTTRKVARKPATKGVSKTVIASYKRQAVALKKEIKTLKNRNNFMRKQVAKFRADVAQMQRHYGSLNSKTRWKVYTNPKVSKEVSNIVRFSNALSNAFTKKKAG